MGSVSFAKHQADPSDNERAVHPTVLSLPPPPLIPYLSRLAPLHQNAFLDAPSPLKGGGGRKGKTDSDSQGEKLHLFLAPCPAMSDNSLFIPWPLYDIEAYQQ